MSGVETNMTTITKAVVHYDDTKASISLAGL